jgi:tRNA A-37 threonylcarbamoyl transferase component Bud32
VTRRVEGAIDLDEALALGRSGRIDRRTLSRLARAAGRLVRALHDAGCRHADLTTKNMLVERSLPREPKMWILDLDRASLVPELRPADRGANLARLYRYVLRRT